MTITGIPKAAWSDIRSYCVRVEQNFQRIFHEEMEFEYITFGQEQVAILTEEFKSEMNDVFYNAYPGKNRKNGLHNLIYFDMNANGAVNYYDWDDPSLMPPGRDERASSGYMYNLVFVMGYHGGATGGPYHPSPGTPRGRKVSPEYISENNLTYRNTDIPLRPWQRWGSATQGGPSPMSYAESHMPIAEKEKLQPLFEEHVRSAAEISVERAFRETT